jgi:hypothetical protein
MNVRKLLINQNIDILNDETLSDFTINARGTEYKVHKLMLSAGSEYFKTMFHNATFNKQTCLNIDRDPFTVYAALEEIYLADKDFMTDPNSFTLNAENSIDLYLLMDEWQVNRTKSLLWNHIIEQISSHDTIIDYIPVVWNRLGCFEIKTNIMNKLRGFYLDDMFLRILDDKKRYQYVRHSVIRSNIVNRLHGLDAMIFKEIMSELIIANFPRDIEIDFSIDGPLVEPNGEPHGESQGRDEPQGGNAKKQKI